MFENSLYDIINLQQNHKQICAQIRLNPEHEIFKGHFPNMPILPGVCTLQIIKEICAKAFGQSLKLTFGDNLKFTAIVIPDAQKQLSIDVTIISHSSDQFIMSCQLACENMVSFKMKATYLCTPKLN